MRTLKIGLLIGREWSFPPAFIEEVNRRREGVVAELIRLGGTRMDEPCPYTVIIDRISHEIPYYRIYLKYAVLQGVAVVNNPFMQTADDKFFEASLATKLGIASPKTVVLPNKDYNPGIVHAESLRNLIYPLDWQRIIDYVGLPCVLKDASGDGSRDGFTCHSLEDLLYRYNQIGLRTAIVQEVIKWQQYVRCIGLGQEEVLPVKYDPHDHKYRIEDQYLSPELRSRVVEDSLKFARTLGYDMNSLDWAISNGVPYAIDFLNPTPEMDIYSLTPFYFDWVIKHMADMAIRLAKQPRPQKRELRWDTFLREDQDPIETHLANDASA